MANPLDNLKPFTGGPDPRRGPGGRPSYLDDANNSLRVAEAFVSGMTRKAMAEEFQVNRNTITRWRRDPRVKAHVSKLTEDRILTITRKVDSEIERRLGHIGNMTVKEILEIRKEYLGGTFRQDVEGVDDETTTQAMRLLEANPQLVSQMLTLLSETTDNEIPTTS